MKGKGILDHQINFHYSFFINCLQTIEKRKENYLKRMRFLIKKKEETFSMALSFLLFGAITSLLFLKKESSWTKLILGSDLQVHQEFLKEKARSFVIEDYDRKCFLLHS